MKRYLIAGGVGTMVFAAALGSASALNITDDGTVQYGESANLECDADGVAIEYYTTSDNTSIDNGPATSNKTRVTGIDQACFGESLVVVLHDENGNKLAKATVPSISSSAHSVNYPAVPAADIEGVRLLIG